MPNMPGLDLLKTRRSVRSFKNEIVNKEVLEKIMDTARFAPSWANFQVVRYTFITNQEKLVQLVTDGVKGFSYNINTLKNAKNVAVVSVVKGKSGKLDPEGSPYATSQADAWESFDAGIACQTFCLAAHAYGVATCIMGVIDHKEVANIAELPDTEAATALIIYGYAQHEPTPSTRLEVAELTRYLE